MNLCKTKEMIDNSIMTVLKADGLEERVTFQDNEKLTALRARIIEEVNATNTPIRTYLKRVYKLCRKSLHI